MSGCEDEGPLTLWDHVSPTGAASALGAFRRYEPDGLTKALSLAIFAYSGFHEEILVLAGIYSATPHPDGVRQAEAAWVHYTRHGRQNTEAMGHAILAYLSWKRSYELAEREHVARRDGGR